MTTAAAAAIDLQTGASRARSPSGGPRAERGRAGGHRPLRAPTSRRAARGALLASCALVALLLAGAGCGSAPVEVVERRPEGDFVGELVSFERSAPADLLTALHDDGSLAAGLDAADPVVRVVAARGLAQLPSDAGGAALLERATAERDARVLAEIAFALGQWGDRAAAPALAAMLAHDAPAVRAAAVEALGKTHDDGYTDAAVELLRDADADVRGRAALALFRFDGRRFEDVERTTTEEQLNRRDQALAAAALKDPDPGVRWRAAYTLANVRGRRGVATILELCLADSEPTTRVFAARGLGELAGEGHGSLAAVAPLVNDREELVAVEAALAIGEHGELPAVAALAREHPVHHVRRIAVEALGERVDDATPARDEILGDLRELARRDASSTVRRAARSALVRLDADDAALAELAHSPEPRDRAAAAELLAEGDARDDALLGRLLRDEQPMVRAAAMPALADERFGGGVDSLGADLLTEALDTKDPAVLTAAAQAAAPHVESGRADPRLLLALAAAVERCDTPDEIEPLQALQDALGLPRGTADPPPVQAEGKLLDRLLAAHRRAAADPRPRVRIDTSRGPLVLELYRDEAPLHVASFLELSEQHFYDGLELHRVVPNFVVQGLDPRADGWGTGGRRLPDELNPVPYVRGTVGMPNSGPNTGGCQLFITHVPTPHLDGGYTVFGRVVDGLDVVAQLDVGDVVTRVQRVDGAAPAASTAEAPDVDD